MDPILSKEDAAATAAEATMDAALVDEVLADAALVAKEPHQEIHTTNNSMEDLLLLSQTPLQ